MNSPLGEIHIRQTQTKDFAGLRDLSLAVYPEAVPWSAKQFESHLKIFPKGQLVAVEEPHGLVVGLASSLIISWDDYEVMENWKDFTDNGMFTNHDPENGKTLYGAEVMVHPKKQGLGIGKKLYAARRKIAQSHGLLRIRAGARLRNYHNFAKKMSAQEYTKAVVRGEIGDPTLSFQINQGFKVLAVVPGYLQNDSESQGFAAMIEWLNPEIAKPKDYHRQVTPYHPKIV